MDEFYIKSFNYTEGSKIIVIVANANTEEERELKLTPLNFWRIKELFEKNPTLLFRQERLAAIITDLKTLTDNTPYGNEREVMEDVLGQLKEVKFVAQEKG